MTPMSTQAPTPTRREQILREAARLFADRGFHGVGVDEIGAAVGISGPGLYRHFAGKDAMLCGTTAVAPETRRASEMPATQATFLVCCRTVCMPSPIVSCRARSSHAAILTMLTPGCHHAFTGDG